nr:WD40 repeat domain-containing protein [Streptomyces sp. TLI_235]
MNAVTTAALDGRTIAVSAASDRTVRIWDLDRGTQLGDPVTCPTGEVRKLTVGTVGGRPTIVTGDWRGKGQVRLWDLATRETVDDPLTGLESVFIDFFAVLDGRLVGATSGGIYCHFRVWDLITREAVGGQIGNVGDEKERAPGCGDGGGPRRRPHRADHDGAGAGPGHR